MMLFANSVHCADADRKPLDEESLRSYMAGEYDLIGRKPDSIATYTGRVTLRDERGVLQVMRAIEGKTGSIRYHSRHRSYSRVKNAFSFWRKGI